MLAWPIKRWTVRSRDGQQLRLSFTGQSCDLRSVLVWGTDESRGAFGNDLAQFGDLYLAELGRIVYWQFGNEADLKIPLCLPVRLSRIPKVRYVIRTKALRHRIEESRLLSVVLDAPPIIPKGHEGRSMREGFSHFFELSDPTPLSKHHQTFRRTMIPRRAVIAAFHAVPFFSPQSGQPGLAYWVSLGESIGLPLFSASLTLSMESVHRPGFKEDTPTCRSYGVCLPVWPGGLLSPSRIQLP
jgi:hypothetical protein